MLEITSGLYSSMVMQRNAAGVSDQNVRGVTRANVILYAGVKQNGRAVRGLKEVKLGAARDMNFAVRLRGIPMGGPYGITIEAREADGGVVGREIVENVLVGDVWLCAGQSNMEGLGLLSEALEEDDRVRAFYMEHRWGVAKDPIHNLKDAKAPVHALIAGGENPIRDAEVGTGPAVAFGQSMEKSTNVPQGLISCAHGGTSMAQWDPALKDEGTSSLYGAMLHKVEINGGRVAGMIWYQGCSDTNPDDVKLYTGRMKQFAGRLRADLKAPKLPVGVVQISRTVNIGGDPSSWCSIREQQRRLPETIDRTAVVSTIDLPLQDFVHIRAGGQHEIGRRLAEAVLSIIGKKRYDVRAPIALSGVEIKRRNGGPASVVEVTFKNIAGELTAGSRAAGFSVANGLHPVLEIIHTELRGNKAILYMKDSADFIEELDLYYGFGLDPYCNIVDANGRSLPAFGPVSLGRPRLATPFVTTADLSELLPLENRHEIPAYPKDVEFSAFRFPAAFLNLHPRIAETAPDNRIAFYRFVFTCPEPMSVSADIGYDGPLTVWLDGKEVYNDPDGINPALPGDAEIPLKVKPGLIHELIVGLGTNAGRAWGIYFRMVRTDKAPPASIEERTKIAMPEFPALS